MTSCDKSKNKFNNLTTNSAIFNNPKTWTSIRDILLLNSLNYKLERTYRGILDHSIT